MTPDEFEALVLDVGAHTPILSSEDVVRLVRLGQSGDEEEVPVAGVFGGRSVTQLTSVTAPARGMDPADGEALFKDLLGQLEKRGIATVPTWGSYVVMAIAAGPYVGWERSVDLHAWAMLGPDRVAQPGLGDGPPGDEWDAAAFRWLHESIYSEQPPSDWIEEVARRRDIRRSMARVPLELVAQSVCEAPLPAPMLERLSRGSRGVALAREEIRSFWLSTSTTAPREAQGWVERVAGSELTDPLMPGPGVTAQTLAGHAVGWMLRREIRIDHALLRYTDGYAIGLSDLSVSVEDPEAVLRAHSQAVSFLSEILSPPSLEHELVLWAWLMDQAGQRGSLKRLLERRM
jgi:hypothetical protein